MRSKTCALAVKYVNTKPYTVQFVPQNQRRKSKLVSVLRSIWKWTEETRLGEAWSCWDRLDESKIGQGIVGWGLVQQGRLCWRRARRGGMVKGGYGWAGPDVASSDGL